MIQKKYRITLYGCHDYTRFYMELTEVEAELLGRVCELSDETSSYQCMPIMECELED